MGHLHNLVGSTDAVNNPFGPVGDYQGAHVVRGDTVADVLNAMEHNLDGLLERTRVASEQSIRCNQLVIPEPSRLMDQLEAPCARAPISRTESL